MGWGAHMTPGFVIGCAENIIKTMVFVRFYFFKYLVNWMTSNRLSDVFLVAFWVPWAHFFLFFRVLGAGMKIDDFLGVAWEGPG